MSEEGEVGDLLGVSGEERLSDLDTVEADDGSMLIELDAYGEIDDDGFLDRDNWNSYKDLGETVTNDGVEEIELSSDEEVEPADEVSLVLLRRPPALEPHDATIDILDSDEEFPVCIVEGEKPENVNIVEKRGRLEEYIELEGLGMIFSDEHGLVLFHLSQVWLDGQQLSPARTRQRLQPGAQVSFYDQTMAGEEFSRLSTDNILHQALVVWTGERPSHLMRNIDQNGALYAEELGKQREMFMTYVNGEVFLPCHLVRVKGVVVGYITNRLGIIECEDANGRKVNVFFHVEDVLIFKTPLVKWEQKYHCSPGSLLPVGLTVSLDARSIEVAGVDNLQYQAILVLAGSWPPALPVLLPGGPGSYSQAFDVPHNSTFYYLELCLEAKLVSKMGSLKEELRRTQGDVVFIRRNVESIRSGRDLDCWRQQFTNKPKRPRVRGQERNFSRDVKHQFRAPPVRLIKTKTELDCSSSVATAGDTGSSLGSLSEGGSHMSRPVSRLSHTSSCLSSKSSRDWYNPNYWRHGGLRIKPEIKSEDEGEWEPPVKRVKIERYR